MVSPTYFCSFLVILVSLTPYCSVSVTGRPLESTFSDVEEAFLNVPSPKSTKQNLRFITSRPHVAGTKGDAVMASFVREKFVEAGIPKVDIFQLDAYLNYPRNPPIVELLDPHGSKLLFKASLSEEVLDFDSTSDTPWRNHTFHGYGPSGDVHGPLVFANYGRPQDFEALENYGVNVTGCIVLIRYGKCFRGLKVQNAQKRGALGVFIYSDPEEDGFVQGPVYPDGPWRSKSSVQRGSVQFISQCAGDPMRADARYNASVSEICGVSNYTDLIPRIPSLPLSYADALPLLKSLRGKRAMDVFENFRGGLNITYHLGPSSNIVHLVVNNIGEVRGIPNVIGVIPGSLPSHEDMPVLLGNHRDAWVFGSADPNSGTTALIEVARGLGELIENGWQPLRSIYLLSWSGEEYGLLGSTGWAELNRVQLKNAVAYLNVDTIVSGDVLRVSTTPSLATLWQNVMRDLNSTLCQHSMPFGNSPLGQVLDSNTDWLLNHPKAGILGSGSDYTVFLDHLGIASMDFRFEKKTTYGQYHSVYDSFTWMDKFGGIEGRPGSAFELMAFGAKIWGLMALRLADRAIVPVDQILQGHSLELYVRAISEQKTGLDLTALETAVANYRAQAATLQLTCSTNHTHVHICNTKLGLVERRFLSESGLPGRPWFKHVLQAPGLSLGYAAEALPGVQQAIDDGDLNLAKKQVKVVADLIEKAASFLSIGSAPGDR